MNLRSRSSVRRLLSLPHAKFLLSMKLECFENYSIKYMVDLVLFGNSKDYRWVAFASENGLDVCVNLVTWAGRLSSRRRLPSRENRTIEAPWTWCVVYISFDRQPDYILARMCGWLRQQIYEELCGDRRKLGSRCASGKKYSSRVQCSWNR